MITNNNEDCQVCKYIRWYFMIGVPIVIFTWMQPELNIFRGLNLSNIVAAAITIGLISLIAWKYYHEKKGR
jgi:disulfide bond formation protein DsbB